MATYSVSATDRGVYENTLAANVEDTVTFAADLSTVEIEVLAGGPVYFTTTNAPATVKGGHCFDAHFNTAVEVQVQNGPRLAGATVIRLISSTSSVYSVGAA
jgi:hypothetical protein